jgi:hypothetical protein
MLRASMARVSTAFARTWRGLSAALRSRPGVFLAVAGAMALFNLIAPVAVLSLVRKPVDFFTFNPWLRRLPAYLASSEPLAGKLAFLSQLTVAWASADKDGEDVEWAFMLDVPTLARIACTALVFGAWFALWAHRRRTDLACGAASAATRRAGVLGAATSVFGLTTGPCSLAGCGAPVLPVLGLAFSGVSAGTLSAFAALSRISVAVLVLMGGAILWSGWRAGAAPQSDAPVVTSAPRPRGTGSRPRPRSPPGRCRASGPGTAAPCRSSRRRPPRPR